MGTRPLVACMQDDLVRVIEKYTGQGITVAEAVGVFEIVKLDVYTGHKIDDEEPEDEVYL